MIHIPVPHGELADKLSILSIKLDRIADPAKRANVAAEHDALTAVAQAHLPAGATLDALRADLRSVNEALWDIEDDIRDCERAGDFGPEFVRLARAVYVTNDRRAALKRAINDHLGSELVEEKSYADYGPGPGDGA
ncbi:MAG: hypothetical protein ACU0BF_02435 [Paracoccaceae bacterium]